MLLQRDDRYNNLRIENLPHKVLLSTEKIHEQWGVFLCRELGNYLQTTAKALVPKFPISAKYKGYFYEDSVDVASLFPQDDIINACKTVDELEKYAKLLPSEWEQVVKIAEIRGERADGSKCARKVWQLISKWKMILLLHNKKSYYFGWCANQGTAQFFEV